MLKSKFKNLINFLKNKKILITTHNLVDIDGLTSCFALKYFISQILNVEEVHVFFSEFSRPAREYLDKMIQRFPEFDFSFIKMNNFSGFEVLLILDTNNLNLIKTTGDFDIPFIFIDHHMASNEECKNNLSSCNIIEEDYTSTAEIVYELFEYYDIKLPNVITWLLLCGLLVDSGRFRHGNNDTIKRASKLLNNVVEIQEIFTLLRKDEHISEKMGKLKGLQRVEVIQAGKYLIGTSHVSAYEASVASTLLTIGFDVSIVLAEKKKGFNISTRARKDLCFKTGLHLGKILDDVAKSYKGTGGGHNGAASMTGQEEHEIVMVQIIDEIKQILKKE